MSNDVQNVEIESSQETHGSFLSYTFGFILSLLLTFLAFFLVAKKILSGWPLILVIVPLGVFQAFIQLFCFLHLGAEKRPRRNLMVFLFMALVLVILVSGSIWIMYNLDTRLMETPK